MRTFFFSLIAVAFFQNESAGQSQEKAYSALLINFARNFQWPASSVKDRFVITVFEYDPLANELDAMLSTAKVNGKNVEIKRITSVSEIDGSQILFLPAFKGKMLPEILDAIQKKPTLVITNKMDLAKKGSGINFLLVNGKLQYEINSKSIEARGIRIPPNIKALGIEVNGG